MLVNTLSASLKVANPTASIAILKLFGLGLLFNTDFITDDDPEIRVNLRRVNILTMTRSAAAELH
jgi:hypothetical protein